MKRRIIWALGIAICEACNKKRCVLVLMTGLVGLTCTPFGSLMDWSDLGPTSCLILCHIWSEIVSGWSVPYELI